MKVLEDIYPFRLFLVKLLVKFCKYIPDIVYLKMMYYLKTNERLHLKHPITFNEKLQWLKLYNRKPEYTIFVDKIAVKKYVANMIGEEYIIPTLGNWNSFDEIDFDKLPERFVLKCNHDSGGIIICKDKYSFNRKAAREKIENSLRRNYYYKEREWPYKNVKPVVFAEKYMVDESGLELKDYKIFCFNGKPYIIQVDFNRFVNHRRNIYFTDWILAPFEYGYPRDLGTKIVRPKCLDEMLNFAAILSKDIPFVRVDFYVICNKIFFGELTFYPEAGFGKFMPNIWDAKLGKMIKISI